MAAQKQFGQRGVQQPAYAGQGAARVPSQSDGTGIAKTAIVAGLLLFVGVAGFVVWQSRDYITGLYELWVEVSGTSGLSSESVVAPANVSTRLLPRSSYGSDEAFRESDSYKAAQLVSNAYPLAVMCNDKEAQAISRRVLIAVMGRDGGAYERRLVQMSNTRRKLIKIPEGVCNSQLPHMMNQIRDLM